MKPINYNFLSESLPQLVEILELVLNYVDDDVDPSHTSLNIFSQKKLFNNLFQASLNFRFDKRKKVLSDKKSY